MTTKDIFNDSVKDKKTQEFIAKAQMVHGDKYNYSKVEYKNNSTKVCIICPEHGEFYQRPKDHLRGNGCPKCGIKKHAILRSSNTEEFMRNAKRIHGDKYDYSKVNYINSKTKVCIICPCHDEFWQTPTNHLRGSGCPMCADRQKNNRKTKEEFIRDAKRVHGDKYDYSKVEYKNNYTKVCIICPEHGEFLQTPNGHLKGRGCPECSPRKRRSEIKCNSRIDFIEKAHNPKDHLRGRSCAKRKIKNRIGEKNIASCGEEMTIIDYRGAIDIDVRFPDGTIRKNVAYASFKRGEVSKIKHDTNYLSTLSELRIGTKSKTVEGDVVECIAFRNSDDIDIKLESGRILKHKKWYYFIKQKYHTPCDIRHVGEEKYARNGQKMTLVEYNCNDCTIRFEDGTVRSGIQYGAFCSGDVGNPTHHTYGNSYNELFLLTALEQYGFKKIYGKELLSMGFVGFSTHTEIDVFARINDVNIGIEYDGHYHNYKSDKKKNDLCIKNNIHLIRIQEPHAEEYTYKNIDFFRLNSCDHGSQSLKDTIIKLGNRISEICGCEKMNFNFDNAFDDVVWKKYKSHKAKYAERRVGQQRIATNGQKITILKYHSYKNSDIEFEDGYIVHNVNYGAFLKGNVLHPMSSCKDNRMQKLKSERLGKRVKNNDGEFVTVIDYRKTRDMDVMFEDGIIAKNVSWCNFIKGNIKKNKHYCGLGEQVEWAIVPKKSDFSEGE